MTVSSTTNKQSYNGNGSQSVFAYTFKIFADTDIKVYVGTTLKSLNTHYTLSGVASAGGGNVTFTSGNIPAAGTGNITILRSLALTQGVDLVNYGRFDAEVIESELDRLVMKIQQLQEQADRTIRFSTTVSDAGGVEITDSISERSGKVLAYDALGDLSVANELGDWQGDWITGGAYSVRDLIKDPITSNVYICLTNHTSGTLSADVSASKWALVVDAVAVANSVAQAQAVLDSFDDRYLGPKASAPPTDNDGDALIEGALYFDTTSKVFKVWTIDLIWIAISPSNSEMVAIQNAAADAASASSSASAAAASAAEITALTTSISTLPAGTSASSSYNSATGILSLGIPTGPTGLTGDAPVNGIDQSVEYTSTAGQTTFSVVYDVGFITVYLNGIRLDAADYTASNGTSVILDVATALNDIVYLQAFGAFDVMDAAAVSAITNLVNDPTLGGDLSGTTSTAQIATELKPHAYARFMTMYAGGSSLIHSYGISSITDVGNGACLNYTTNAGQSNTVVVGVPKSSVGGSNLHGYHRRNWDITYGMGDIFWLQDHSFTAASGAMSMACYKKT